MSAREGRLCTRSQLQPGMNPGACAVIREVEIWCFISVRVVRIDNFLGVIERDFANPNVDGEEKSIFIPDDYRELDFPEAPPHDPTIESDYPFW
jgi:hypothetical protein